MPPISGLAKLDYLTNENLYELDTLPKSLIILGEGLMVSNMLLPLED